MGRPVCWYVDLPKHSFRQIHETTLVHYLTVTDLHQRTTVHLTSLQQKREEDEAAYQAHVAEVSKQQETIVQLDKSVYVMQRQIDELQARCEQTRQRLQEQLAAELEQINSLRSRSARSDSRFEQLALERAETVNKLEAAQNQLQRHTQLCKEQQV